MSLECRSCGERLPMLILTDAAVASDTLPPPPDTLWQVRAPEPAPFEPTIAGAPLELASAPASGLAEALSTVVAAAPLGSVTITSDATVMAKVPSQRTVSTAADPDPNPSSAAGDDHALPVQALAAEAGAGIDGASNEALSETAAPPPLQTELSSPPAAHPGGRARPTSRSPSIIERLSAAQPTFEFQAKTIAPPPDLSAGAANVDDGAENGEAVASIEAIAEDESETQPTVLGGTNPIMLPSPDADAATADTTASETQSARLNAESASEIAVSHEAETLVEASVAPVPDESPEVISVADTQIDDIAGQLRSGAWRHAMPIEASPLPPAVIHIEPPPDRRLSMRRVGLAVGSVGAIAAAIVFVRLHPGPGSTASVEAVPPGAAHTAEQATIAAQPPSTQKPAASQLSAPPQANATHAAPATSLSPDPATAPATALVVHAGAASTAAVSAPAAALAPDSMVTAPAAGDVPREIAQTATEKRVAVAATSAAAGTAAVANAAATEPKPAQPAARRAPITRASTETNAPARASGAAFEAPRVCTPAIAALGLCTLDSSQEKN